MARATLENRDKGVAVVAENAVSAALEQEDEISVEKNVDESADEKAGEQQKNGKCYEIICKNPVSKVIGGVSFLNGVGRTGDAYAASWFRNKEGYMVREV